GIIASVLLGPAGLTLNPAPAKAVVYCQYVEYPAGCVARGGVVLRSRRVARAAVRHNVGGNANGGVNRVGVRREKDTFASPALPASSPQPVAPGCWPAPPTARSA